MNYEYWFNRISCSDSLEEMDGIMFEASEDRELTHAEYIRLCFMCRQMLGEDADGSIY